MDIEVNLEGSDIKYKLKAANGVNLSKALLNSNIKELATTFGDD